MILGLDISTSVVGVCILDSGKIHHIDFINLEKEKNIFDKSKKFKDSLALMYDRFEIDKIGVEENLQAFRPGLSSAKTIVTLARFNGICSYIAQEVFGIQPEFINVNSARKKIGFKLDRKSGKNTKEQVLDFVSIHSGKKSWPTRVLKSGPRKDTVVLIKECYDMADAYVVAHGII